MARTKRELVHARLGELIDHQLGPHDKLPTERELALEFGVSRVTVREALELLENERRVYRIQGAGTFVAPLAITKTIELTSFTDDMRSRGLQPGSQLLSAQTIAAGAEIGFCLGLSPSAAVIHIERVRTADGEPLCLEHSYVSESLVPGLLDQPLATSLYDRLREQYRITIVRAEQTIRATVLDQPTAQLLGVPAFSPALLVERTAFDQRNRPVERAISTYRGDRYLYEITLMRPAGT